MQSFRGMEKYASNTKRVHRGDDFLANSATLTNPTDHKLATAPDGLRDRIYCLREPFLGNSVGLIQVFKGCQGISFGSDDVQGCLQGALAC